MAQPNGNSVISFHVNADAIKTLSDAIIAILDSEVDQDTMRAALQTLERGSSINGATVSNCHFKMESPSPTPAVNIDDVNPDRVYSDEDF